MVEEDPEVGRWSALGLKVGIEIHQQLETSKLFCDCPSELEDEIGPEVHRWLRPTQSEMGEIDRASLLEARKNLQFVYQNPPSASCLVDIDEEPPHDLNEEALDIALTIAKLLNFYVVDEIHIMRKIVIDGSNTTGFQRTALVAIGGEVSTRIGKVPLEVLCLEEDAARKVDIRPGQVVYRLDRLGIPLIEIATGPLMKTPDQVRDVAETIGMVLRATKRVKRGIGTIRQDLNVSISKGNRVEIKGVQDLNAIGGIVIGEVQRQLALAHIQNELVKRGISKDNMTVRPKDITNVLQGTKCNVIANALKKNGKVFAVKLPGFQGLLSTRYNTGSGSLDEIKELMLGRELAAYARTVGVKGIFQSDELPAYGITQEEVAAISDALEMTEKFDAFVMVAQEERTALAAMNLVIERAKMAFDGVPSEVRGVREKMIKGKLELISEFQRPMPGAARMYPETDIPPVLIPEGTMEKIVCPELPKKRIERFVEEYGLSAEASKQLVYSDLDIRYEDLHKRFRGLGGIIARILLNTIPELENEGIMVHDTKVIVPILEALEEGRMAKEGVPDVLRTMVEKGMDVQGALEEVGLDKGLTLDEVKAQIRAFVGERKDLVQQRGKASMGQLMGQIMERYRGKIDGRVLSEILKSEIALIMDH